MRTLYLHVGHGKTGSSYLQSCFALSRVRLAALGVRYCWSRKLKRAAAGRATSGNARILIAAIRRPVLAAPVALWFRLRGGNALFSAEKLFFVLSNPRNNGRLAAFRGLAGFDRIEILLFIRDPAEHLPSVHQQQVKREGATGDIDDEAARYKYPLVARRFLATARADPATRVRVLNYSRVRRPLATIAEDWLGVERETLKRPGTHMVNRSLSAAELAQMRALNARHGKAAAIVADRLCEQLPEIEPHQPAPSPAAARKLEARLAPHVAWMNRRLPPAQRYRAAAGAEAGKTPSGAPAPLSAAQRRVIAAALAEARLPVDDL
ncbi:hypothetical protein G5B40_04165 [Pikeienuella piscinae]|uniref:Sulfotransferase domain-containing protein n=1 Tax=Pikeienuella piscinae TaxID=2748098 RepID=A0A7L5BW02_9RHOB|nr:hypothetical protein [Pikeienuella piscinae]QIE54707.1 hypothetical protein G5B40_04165 [Pikeienuella piscinae]